ncbi:TPA: PHP domain-containing protein [Candidatus Avigastranaerophilus faecigallinarum]|nr:PHP domain-containing protein [Candidatus Avigastranaerophilus faecigallinarum]
MTKFDLHIHSNCSDGSDTVDELAEKIKKAEIGIFALTDHDTVEGCKLMSEKFETGFIKGIELTCLLEDIKCHILGYGIDIENPKLKALIEKGKILRRKKLETRIHYLKDTWDFEFTKEELDWLYSRKSVVKLHLANILVKRGLAENNIAAMEKYLNGCKTGNTRFDGKEAIETIQQAGGIAVWAHPLGGEGEKHLAFDAFIPKLEKMLKYNIQGLECYYSRYNKEEIKFLTECAEKYNLYTTGGSDYHGTNKNIPLTKLNTDNTPVELEVLNFPKIY